MTIDYRRHSVGTSNNYKEGDPSIREMVLSGYVTYVTSEYQQKRTLAPMIGRQCIPSSSWCRGWW